MLAHDEPIRGRRRRLIAWTGAFVLALAGPSAAPEVARPESERPQAERPESERPEPARWNGAEFARLWMGATARADAPSDATSLASQTVLADRIRDRIEKADLGAGIGVSVMNLRSGRAIVSHNATKPLNPASNMKLITAAVSLIELGPDFQMRTGLYGRQQDDAIVGGLYLKGYGDPTLDSAALLGLARQLVDRGVRKVDELLVDGSYFDSEVLAPAFEQQPHEKAPFRAAVAAVSVDANAYTMRIQPGPEAGATALVHLDGAGHFDVSNKISTTSEGPPKVIAVQTPKDDKLELQLSGDVPLGITGVSYRRRVESPLYFAGYKMVEALRSMRVQLPQRVTIAKKPRGAPLLASRVSPPLSSVLYALGKRSDNFVAEMLLKILGAESTRKPGSSRDGVRVALDTLKRLGVPTSKLDMVNGSGLFTGNRVAPSHLTRLLQAMYHDAALRPEFMSQLAIGGVDGTLERRLEQLPAPRIVRAKTGTLADTIALSGYVLGKHPDRAIAFSFLANGVRGKQHAARTLADAIVNDIALHLHQDATRGRRAEND